MSAPVPQMVQSRRPIPRVERFKALPQVELVGHGTMPLIDPKDPASKQIQYRPVARCKIFDLLKPEELAEYERIWQMIADDRAILAQHEVRASPDGAVWRAYLRWGEKTYRVQAQ